MKMYFSGSFRDQVARYMIERDACRLFTYAYPKEVHSYLNIASAQGKRVDVMIDSGAFTAWNKGTPVVLQKLLDWHDSLLQMYGDHHDFTFIALDVIPGERGRMATPVQIAEGMERSMDNFLIMQEHHTYPVLPVYHSGEPVSFRDDFLKFTNHICLSMNQNLTERERVSWATQAQVDGAKMHGLAATGTRIMEYVDWYSVDSAGWLMTAAMGKILWYNGKRLFPIDISSTSPELRRAEKHVFNRSDKDALLQYISDRGYDPQDLSENYLTRCLWNVDMWTQFTPRRRVMRDSGLFDL